MTAVTPEDRELMQAASHALKSYAYGNESPDLAISIAEKLDAALRSPEAAAPKMKHVGEYCSVDPVAAEICESLHADKWNDIMELSTALRAVKALCGGHSQESRNVVAIIDKALEEHGDE